jgi:predicted short-subunit dehydrogenase-like oxidoreductase (DUF2520 family)
MLKISVLGTGNVASHFIKAFDQCAETEIVQVYNHRKNSLKDFNAFETTTDLKSLKTADVYLICIKDDAVKKIVNELNVNGTVAHSSGSLPLLDSQNRDAVFYPLQTFSKDKDISFKDLPICIEAEHDSDREKLKILAKNITAKAYDVDSKQRQELHLAAVFVCNFVNHLYHIGHDICKEKDLPFDILRPLIQETADKINFKDPKQAQTGPAKRNDQSTINRHIQQLESPDYKELYRYLTTSIQKAYE